MDDTRDVLVQKLKALTQYLWSDMVNWPMIAEWLKNFPEGQAGGQNERLHGAFLLSQFMYFGIREMRELLKALYRDVYKYPIVERHRRSHSDSVDCKQLNALFEAELQQTRFLGVGNPSESGTHLLYYFRQENGLPRRLFINGHEVFDRTGGTATPRLKEPDIRHYVFIDDFCGSGTQATRYSASLVADIKRLNPETHVSYYVLFSTARGIERVKAGTAFDDVACVCELDETFRCFSETSRYFRNTVEAIDKEFAEAMCRNYGADLLPGHELGYDDGQLLIGFFHNVPDNTLPVIWKRQSEPIPWVPRFQTVSEAIRRGRDVKVPRENPFNVTKAVDLDDKQIGDYWVDLPGGGGFQELVRPTSPMPMIILGGKGSGKTHILRYCSYQVQRMLHKSDVGAGLQEDGYIGIYLRCGGLNASRFSGKGPN